MNSKLLKEFVRKLKFLVDQIQELLKEILNKLD